jgi:hypothetical protein
MIEALMIKLIFAAVIVFGLLLTLKRLMEHKKRQTAKNLAYKSRKQLFSPAERSFLGVLEDIIGKKY